MKITPFILSAFFLAASCNSKPKLIDTSMQTTDTSNASQATINEMEVETIAVTEPIAKKKTGGSQPSSRNAASSATTTNSTVSETGNTQAARKGWSKTAKGAVIGGVVGAGSGAVVNKKNRAAGAVIGGVIGAGAGAVIGNEADKQDGRH